MMKTSWFRLGCLIFLVAAPCFGADIGMVTLVDGRPKVLRGTAWFNLSEGVRVRDGDTLDVDALLDAESLLEVHKRWAKELIVGYARLDGRVVGWIQWQAEDEPAPDLVGRHEADARPRSWREHFGIP